MLHVVADQFCMSKCTFSRSSFLQFEYGYNFVDSGIENFSEDFSANSFNVRLVFNY